MNANDPAARWIELLRPSVRSHRLVLSSNLGLEDQFQLSYRNRRCEALRLSGPGPGLITDGARLIQWDDMQGEVSRARLRPSGVSWAGRPALGFKVEAGTASDHWCVVVSHLPSGQQGLIRCYAVCGLNLHTRCRLEWPSALQPPTPLLAAVMYWWTHLENDRLGD